MNRPPLLLLLFFSLLVSFPAVMMPAAESGADNPAENEENLIIISADRAETDIEAGQKTVITRDEWERSGARTVAEAVETAPGVQVERSGTSLDQATVSIRGSSGEQVLVIINGVPVNGSRGGAVNLNSFSLENVESIEVIRGGNSAVYGEGAFGGVINITTSDHSGMVPDIGFSMSAGSFATFGAAAHARGSLTASGSLEGYLTAEARGTGGEYDYSDSDGNETRVNSNGWLVNAAGGSSWNLGALDRNVLYLDTEAYYSKRGVPGLMEFLTPEAEMEEYRISGSLGWKHSGWSGFGLDSGASMVSRYSSYVNPEDSVDEDHNSQSVVGRLEASHTFNRSKFYCTPVLGVDGSYEHLISSGLRSSGGTVLPGTASRWDLSLYSRVEMEYRRFFLLPALRWDYSDTSYVGWSNRQDSYLSWSLTGGWGPSDKFKLSMKANVGTAYRAPSFNDLFWSNGSFASGNPDLLPEESFNWDAGVSWGPWTGLSADVIWYSTLADNLIQWQPTTGGTWKPINISEATVRGIESSAGWLIPLSRKRTVFLEIGGSYTWLQARETTEGSINAGNQLPYRPEHSASADLSLLFGRQSLSISGRYIGYRFTNSANTKYLDPVLTFDAVLRVLLWKRVTGSLSVQNLADVQYYDRLGYPVPGREITISGGYQF